MRDHSQLRSLEEVDLVAGLQLDDRLLPAGAAAAVDAAPLRLRLHLDDVHAHDLDLEQLLDRLTDLGLVGVRVHPERVAVLRDLVVALLAHDGGDQDLAGMAAHAAHLPCRSGSAASLTTSERAQTTCDTSSSAGTVTSTCGRLRNDLTRASSSSCATTTVGAGRPQSSSSCAACFVDGAANASPATRPRLPAWAWSLSAARSAARAALRFTLSEKSRGPGGKTTPPPVNCGALIVPCRRAFSSARTASCTRWGLISAANTASSRATSFVAPPPSSGAFGLATADVLPDLEQAVLGTRHGAAHEQQMTLGVDGVDGQADLRDPLTAHPAGHPHSLEDPRRGRRGADRAGLANVVRAVGLGPAAEAVPLHRPLEPLADPGPRDLDPVAGTEDLDGYALALHGLGEVAAELDEVPVGAVDAGLRQVPAFGLRQLPLGHATPGELDRLVAVGFGCAHRDHGPGPRLDHGHRRDGAALLVEDLGHPQLLSDQPAHAVRA